MAAGELSIVLGDRVAVAFWNPGRIGIANRTAVALFELLTQPQLQGVHVTDELLMDLLDQARISWEPAGIEIAHLVDERSEFALCLRIVLHDRANRAQKVQALVNLALRIGRVRPLWRCSGTAALELIAAWVPGPLDAAIAIAPATVAHGSSHTVADTIHSTAHLAGLAGLSVLSRLATGAALLLATWTGLLAARQRVALELLTCRSGLARSRITAISAETCKLVAQTRKIVHRAVDRGILGGVFSSAQCPRRVLQLLAQLLQIAGESGFGLIGKVACAEPVRAALHARIEIGIIHGLESAAQLARCPGLSGGKFSRLIAHLLRKVRQVVGHFLAIVDHFVDVLARRIGWLFARRTSGVDLGHQIAHAISLLFLLRRQLIRSLGHGIEAAGGILLLETAQQIRSFSQPVGRAAGIRGTGTL